MKKFNVTYEQVASYSNIYAAYLDARKGKSERNEIMRFSLELDAHLNDLYNDLQEERYKVSGYRIIYIHVPKKRLIMALHFKILLPGGSRGFIKHFKTAHKRRAFNKNV